MAEMRVEDIDTPAPVVDLDRVERNLKRAAGYFADKKIALRPHIKTHKIVEFARRQVELGAAGITCQKLGEAEVMADGGVTDILMTFPILGRSKLERLVALAKRVRMSAVTDSAEVADGIAQAAAAAGVKIELLVECDTGTGRCGVQNAAEAVALAERISNMRGVTLGGLMVYPEKNKIERSREWIAEALAALSRSGLEAKTVSVGGTPDMYRAHELKHSTEHRPGTYIYSDRYTVEAGVGTLDDTALRVVATVVSRPTADRAVLDAGSKTLTSDLMGFQDHGLILEYPKARIVRLNEEHGVVDLSDSPEKPRIGERVTIVPNHCCVVSNMFDSVYAVSDGRVVREIKVAARGLVR
jgi:D-serine deaminase-like pyridoxal phosphate-dependent protein